MCKPLYRIDASWIIHIPCKLSQGPWLWIVLLKDSFDRFHLFWQSQGPNSVFPDKLTLVHVELCGTERLVQIYFHNLFMCICIDYKRRINSSTPSHKQSRFVFGLAFPPQLLGQILVIVACVSWVGIVGTKELKACACTSIVTTQYDILSREGWCSIIMSFAVVILDLLVLLYPGLVLDQGTS